jgi:hypothetical protein
MVGVTCIVGAAVISNVGGDPKSFISTFSGIAVGEMVGLTVVGESVYIAVSCCCEIFVAEVHPVIIKIDKTGIISKISLFLLRKDMLLRIISDYLS